jgi:hypothetical protein
MQRTSSTSVAALVAAASIVTSACIPIPLMSGYESASRQNIPAQVPGFIIKGETTRADVVLALGEPDRHADDGSWLLYSSPRSANDTQAPSPTTMWSSTLMSTSARASRSRPVIISSA